MTSNRLDYDECAYKLKVKRSTDPLSYALYNGRVENCNECFSYFGMKGGNEEMSLARCKTDTYFGTMTQVESELKNMIIPHDKCNDRGKNDGYLKYEDKKVHKPLCSPFLDSSDTRFMKPAINYRSYGQFDKHTANPYLPLDPKANVTPQPVRDRTHSRLIVRDQWKTPEFGVNDFWSNYSENTANNVNYEKGNYGKA